MDKNHTEKILLENRSWHALFISKNVKAEVLEWLQHGASRHTISAKNWVHAHVTKQHQRGPHRHAKTVFWLYRERGGGWGVNFDKENLVGKF